MRFFTTMNPEVLEHLVNAATSVSAAMRALSEQHPAEGPVAGRTGQPEDTGHGGVGGSNGSEA
jgi:hypothetical protein